MSQAPMSRAESYESSVASPSDASSACMRDEIYDPANRDQLKPTRTESGASKCESDDDFNTYMSDSLNKTNIYENSSERQLKPWEKSLDKGQDRLSRSSDNLENAIASLDAGDSTKAAEQIQKALRNSGKSLSRFDDAVDKQMGGGIRGAYGEDALKDGAREIGGARTEMQDALDLLADGNTGEAYEAIREAMKGLKSGGKEIQAGEDVLTGKTDVKSAAGLNNVTGREFDTGLNNFGRSSDSLSDALNSLDHGDSDGAVRDLLRGQNTLTNGLNNVKDGLKLSSRVEGDKDGIENGLKDATTASGCIDTALELLKNGNVAEAKKHIQGAINELNNGSEKVSEGVDDFSDSQTPVHAYDRNSRGNRVADEDAVNSQDGRSRYRNNGENRYGNGSGEDSYNFGTGENSRYTNNRTGDNYGGNYTRSNDTSSSPLDIFGNLPEPPNPFDLFGGGSGDRGSNGGPLDLFGNLPTPPNPFDLFGGTSSSDDGGNGPLDLFGGLPQPPNPFDLFGGSDSRGGGSSSRSRGPLDLLGGLPQPPNPMDVLGSLPQPPNPIELVSSLPQPSDVLQNITRPDKVINKIFGGLFG